MDDSERSYGYSEDIYHGKKGPDGKSDGKEASYEVAEKEPGLETDDPSPLEEAMRVVDQEELEQQADDPEARDPQDATQAATQAATQSADQEAEDAGKIADGDAAETVTDVQGKPPKESSALGREG